MAKSMRVRTDDQVIVISGKDAGKPAASCAPSRSAGASSSRA